MKGMGVKFSGSAPALFLLCALAASCVYVPRMMWKRAEENRSRMDRVRIGQTIDEVRAVMTKPPEKREVRQRFDGKQIEFWSYVTDYARKIDSTITFVDGRVTEIRATPWQEAD
jgi:hypothetical protein